ncbi:MAG: PhzF family phenazine biosynthesis protein, partial [Acidobacteriota bacterium]
RERYNVRTMIKQLTKTGNSLALVLDRPLLQLTNIDADTPLEVSTDGGVIVTAPGDTTDFVSRYFAPAFGIPEDPVTGSSHCTLVPYWSERTGKEELHALQVSRRGGELFCRSHTDKVVIAGRAVSYLQGMIQLP